MRLRLFIAGSTMVLLGACGSSDGSGTRPSIGATLPSDVSIALPSSPSGTDAAAPPAVTQAAAAAPETAAPEAASSDTAPSGTIVVADDSDDDIVWWPWVLGAIVVVGIVVALSRRHRPGATWRSRTTTLLNDVDQLTSHLAALTPDGLKVVASGDATTLATMRATLSDLIASAPDANIGAVLAALATPMAQLHSAVDAVALSAAQAIPPNTAIVASLVAQVHTTSASVRAQLAGHE
jgi:hypothetical protein